MKANSLDAEEYQPNSVGFHLPHEQLEVYQMELSFVAWATDLLEEAEASGAKRLREVMDQLDRASLSTLLNTAEGNGKRQRPIRAKFFDDARGSATECAACLDALVAKKAVSRPRVVEGKRMLAQSIAMLSRLIEIFEVAGDLREDEPPYYTIGSAAQALEFYDKEKEDGKEKD